MKKQIIAATAASIVALAAYPVLSQTSGSQTTTPSQTAPSATSPGATSPGTGSTGSGTSTTQTTPGAGSSTGTSSGTGTTTGTTSTPSATDTTTGRTTGATAPRGAAGTVTYYQHQSSDMRASRLIGQRVDNMQGENIGDINDLVVGPDGQIRAVVIGVGGFLGLGEREVAVPMNSLQMTAQSSGTGTTSGTTGSSNTVKLNTTKDQLKEAPRWTWGDQGSSTGTGTGTTNRGTGTGTTTTK
jgi:sporulation protein YlmC with PRC-barrel domain